MSVFKLLYFFIYFIIYLFIRFSLKLISILAFGIVKYQNHIKDQSVRWPLPLILQEVALMAGLLTLAISVLWEVNGRHRTNSFLWSGMKLSAVCESGRAGVLQQITAGLLPPYQRCASGRLRSSLRHALAPVSGLECGWGFTGEARHGQIAVGLKIKGSPYRPFR